MAQPTDDAQKKGVRWSEGGGFSVVPEWLLDADISDRAVRLYAALGRFADSDLRTDITRKKIAARLRCSPSTMDVAMKELRLLGAVTVEAQRADAGGLTSNLYTLHIAPETGARSTGASADGCTGGSVEKRNESLKAREEGAKAPSQAVSNSEHTNDPPPIPKLGGQNEPLNKLMDVCGIDAGNRQRVKWAIAALNGRGATQGIVHLFWLEASRWCDEHEQPGAIDELRDDAVRYSNALVNAIDRKAQMYRDAMGGAHLTPTALRDWWLDLERKQRSGGGMTRSDIENL